MDTAKDRRIAIVTGVDQAVGKAIAMSLLDLGIHVVACGPRNSHDLGCERVDLSVEDPRSVEALASIIRLREPDILINAGSISAKQGFMDVSVEDLRRAHTVNFLVPVRLAKAAVTAMKRRRGGHIVNLTSIWGSVLQRDVTVLATTKAALASATVALAHECSDASVSVNSVAVGWIEGEDAGSGAEPSRRIKASEVAGVVAWLISPGASAVMGQNIAADGGLSRFC